MNTHLSAAFYVARCLSLVATVSAASATSIAEAKGFVEFDFARIIECRDVTDLACEEAPVGERLIAMKLPVSVQFRGVSPDDVDELSIEINGASAGLRVVDFAPGTHLASDVKKTIEQTTTTKRGRSLAATLGGELPVPYAELAAHVAPSLTATMDGSEIATEKMDRLPPKSAVVVSGTTSEGHGVFFKLKRFSQTSLEGVHELTVVFAVRESWQGSAVRVGCSALGRREVLWIKQSATLGGGIATVQLHPYGDQATRKLAQRRAARLRATSTAEPSIFAAAAAEMINLVDFQSRGPAHDDRPGHLGDRGM